MPRLLNINNYHYRRGGAEAVYLGHGALFAERGWQTDWFAMEHPENPLETAGMGFARLIDLEYMQGGRNKLQAASAIIWNKDARAKLSAKVDRARPDIAHLHNIYHHLSPSVLAELKARGIPTVLTAHDLKLACPSYKMLNNGSVCERCKGGKVWNLARYRCLKGSLPLSALITVESGFHKAIGAYAGTIDRIVSPSHFYRNKLIEWGWPGERIVTIPNFVTPAAMADPTPAGTGPILYFGRISEEKGIATLIRAAKAAAVPVRIAGAGPMVDTYRALAQEIGAPAEFMGYRTGADLAALINDAAATVLPSEWYENGPMSVMESFLHQRPVIGSAIGGIPELVRDGETGWTYPPNHVGALAGRLAEAMASPPATRAAFGAAGRALVLGDFSPARYYEAMSALYATLLGKDAPHVG